MEPMRVLLIEDNLVDAKILRAFLAQWATGVEIEEARTLAAGLERLAAGDIDAVLLDLHLPDAHGLPALATLHERYPDVPVVILTGDEDEATALRAMRSGAQDHLVKGQMSGRGIVRALRFAIERARASGGRDHDGSARRGPTPDGRGGETGPRR